MLACLQVYEQQLELLARQVARLKDEVVRKRSGGEDGATAAAHADDDDEQAELDAVLEDGEEDQLSDPESDDDAAAATAAAESPTAPEVATPAVAAPPLANTPVAPRSAVMKGAKMYYRTAGAAAGQHAEVRTRVRGVAPDCPSRALRPANPHLAGHTQRGLGPGALVCARPNVPVPPPSFCSSHLPPFGCPGTLTSGSTRGYHKLIKGNTRCIISSSKGAPVVS